MHHPSNELSAWTCCFSHASVSRFLSSLCTSLGLYTRLGSGRLLCLLVSSSSRLIYGPFCVSDSRRLILHHFCYIQYFHLNWSHILFAWPVRRERFKDVSYKEIIMTVEACYVSTVGLIARKRWLGCHCIDQPSFTSPLENFCSYRTSMSTVRYY